MTYFVSCVSQSTLFYFFLPTVKLITFAISNYDQVIHEFSSTNKTETHKQPQETSDVPYKTDLCDLFFCNVSFNIWIPYVDIDPGHVFLSIMGNFMIRFLQVGLTNIRGLIVSETFAIPGSALLYDGTQIFIPLF